MTDPGRFSHAVQRADRVPVELPADEPLRLMCVHAHPDDESSKGAAVMAKYRAEGARVLVVTCTGGERGDILNKRLKNNPEVLRDIAEYRRHEMAEAARILDVEHEWLGFVDSGLPEGDPLPPLPLGCFALEPLEVATEPLVRLIRSFRPHVMTTYDENGGYPHPDHIMTHTVSMAAFDAAGRPDAYPQAGQPWQPAKIYYNGSFSSTRLGAYHEALTAAGIESGLGEWLARTKKRETSMGGLRAVHARVLCSDYFDQRDRALKAHATQVDPDGNFFALPRDLENRVWPWEEFELGRSFIPTEPLEDDLFAGLRPEDPR